MAGAGAGYRRLFLRAITSAPSPTTSPKRIDSQGKPGIEGSSTGVVTLDDVVAVTVTVSVGVVVSLDVLVSV
jgi:hypothetical protein